MRRPQGNVAEVILSRRNLLKLAAASQCWPLLRTSAAAVPAPRGPALGPGEPFSFDRLKARAASMAGKPYVAPPRPNPDLVDGMDYDVMGDIRYNPDRSLYGDGIFPIYFFPVGQLAPKSVRMYALAEGTAREVLHTPDDFIYPPDNSMAQLSDEPSPFAGLQIRKSDQKPDLREHQDWASFIGGSYFRAVGEGDQFGLSARGLAQNTGAADPEEFPDFTHFWIAEGKAETDPVEVYALLDGPSVAGAYRFAIHRNWATTVRATTMEVSCELHLRKPVERLGIAPLTSMYWYSQTAKPTAADWRPALHDSDGLSIWTGRGERLWRPLINPPTLQTSAFLDQAPRGFGLMQRDRNYDHYLDAVFYEKRPCAWVEPLGDWGRGSVQLVEIPTDNEIYDNIIAMWVPAEPNAAGQTLAYDYRLYWRDLDPFPGDLAHCVGTRLGMGAVQGAIRSAALRKFLVEFRGPALTALNGDEVPQAVLSASRGAFSNVLVEPSPDGTRDLWRTQFDLDPQGNEVIEMRAFLAFRGKPLTETWLYRYIPFVSSAR